MDEFTFRYRSGQSIKVVARPHGGHSPQMIIDGLNNGDMLVEDNPFDDVKVIRIVPTKGTAVCGEVVADVLEHNIEKDRDYDFMLESINVPVPVDLSDVELMISEGLENIKYWAKVNVYSRDGLNVTGRKDVKYVGECRITGTLNEGGRFEIDLTDMSHIIKSLGLLATADPDKFQQFRKSRITPNLGFLFLQICIFGEKRYDSLHE